MTTFKNTALVVAHVNKQICDLPTFPLHFRIIKAPVKSTLVTLKGWIPQLAL